MDPSLLRRELLHIGKKKIDFLTFRVNWLARNYLHIRPTSALILRCKSAADLEARYRTVSSAYKVTWQNCKTSGRRFMWIMNNNGPNIEPCATSIETGAFSEVTCFLCVKNEVNRAMAVSSTPRLQSFWSNIVWLTVQNALARPKNTAPVRRPVSKE